MLKRFKSKEMGGSESASRRVGYDCMADYAKSSRAMCRVCEENIDQNELRLALMLQDDEGYKSAAWTHFDCFWKHPETRKLDGTHEIHNFVTLKSADRAKISAAFEKLNSSKAIGKKKGKKGQTSDDSEDDDFSPETKPTAKNTKKKTSASNKRKRNLEDD